MEGLGQSRIRVTMSTYAHVLPGPRQEAGDAIEGCSRHHDGPVGRQIWQQSRHLQDRNGPLAWARSEGLEPQPSDP